jgi:2-phospho-L-lactate/phosphoenolpyruvate guanylyltransferase
MTTAIIPVKPLRESKTRLAHLLSAAERAALMGCLLERTLAGCCGKRPFPKSSSSAAMRRCCSRRARPGSETLREERPFALNTAVTQARDRHCAIGRGPLAVLILPADLPLLQTADIVAVLEAAQTASRLPTPLMVICGDEAQQGTNALLLTPPAPFTFHYGPGSFARHLREAERNGRMVRVVNGRSLQFDLDTEADWHRLQAQFL